MFAVTKLAMIAAIALPPVAANAASDDTRSISVRRDDINLNAMEGQKILALRIDRAAREVCDFAYDQLGHQVRKIERACRNKAKASAWNVIAGYRQRSFSRCPKQSVQDFFLKLR